eukprot:gene30768-24964_t
MISPIVFPLAFSINESYRRREKVLDDYSAFFGAAAEIYVPNHIGNVEWHIRMLIKYIIKYTLDSSSTGTSDNDWTPDDETNRFNHKDDIQAYIYRLFSRLAVANDVIRQSKLKANSPLCTRLIHYHHTMITAFERMRTVREYRTPRTIRSFCKMVVFLLPSMLSPWFAFIATKGAMDLHPFQNRTSSDTLFDQNWSAYYAAIICGLIFGSMQSVQDSLDDPFDGISEDDVDLHSIFGWAPKAIWREEK